MTSSRQLARHGLLYTVGVVVQGMATLVVLPFATRLLGPTEYGQVAVGLSIIQIGAVLAVAGLPIAITRAWFDPGDGPLRARAMLGLLTGFSVLVVATALLLRPAVGGIVSLSVAAVGATSVVVGGQAVLRAQGRPVTFVLTTAAATAGAHVVGLVSAAVHGTAEAYLTGYLVGAGLTAVVAMVITPPVLPWRVPGAVGEGLRIALPVLPHTAAILILNSADPLIVSRLLDPGEAGRYQVAMMLGLAPLAVLSGINNAWSPAIMAAREEERWDFLARTMRPITAVASLCAVGVALLAPLAVRVLAPPEFGHETLARLAQVIALCALAQVVYLGASSVVFNQKRTTPLAVSTPLATAVFVGVAALLVSGWGIGGMAVAKVVGFTALALATLGSARWVARVPWRPGRWLPLAGGAVLVVLALQWVPTSGAWLWIQAAAAAVLGLLAATRLPGLRAAAPSGTR